MNNSKTKQARLEFSTPEDVDEVRSLLNKLLNGYVEAKSTIAKGFYRAGIKKVKRTLFEMTGNAIYLT